MKRSMIALTAFALLAATSFTASANQPQKATAKGDAERAKLMAVQLGSNPH